MRYHPIHLFLSVITKSNSAENRAVLLLLENPLHTDLQPFQVAVHDKPSFSQAEILVSVACIAVADVQVAQKEAAVAAERVSCPCRQSCFPIRVIASVHSAAYRQGSVCLSEELQAVPLPEGVLSVCPEGFELVGCQFKAGFDTCCPPVIELIADARCQKSISVMGVVVPFRLSVSAVQFDEQTLFFVLGGSQ